VDGLIYWALVTKGYLLGLIQGTDHIDKDWTSSSLGSMT
jgi:hypothetical protein